MSIQSVPKIESGDLARGYSRNGRYAGMPAVVSDPFLIDESCPNIDSNQMTRLHQRTFA
jgi:hypothetical protein